MWNLIYLFIITESPPELTKSDKVMVKRNKQRREKYKEKKSFRLVCVTQFIYLGYLEVFLYSFKKNFNNDISIIYSIMCVVYYSY